MLKKKQSRGKVKTKHDITWFAQKTNVDQLNPAYVYDSGGVKKILLFTLYRVGMLRECYEDEDSFYYSLKGSTTKVDDLGVEFLSSDGENWVLVKFLPLN
jgi:hypothetical protein